MPNATESLPVYRVKREIPRHLCSLRQMEKQSIPRWTLYHLTPVARFVSLSGKTATDCYGPAQVDRIIAHDAAGVPVIVTREGETESWVQLIDHRLNGVGLRQRPDAHEHYQSALSRYGWSSHVRATAFVCLAPVAAIDADPAMRRFGGLSLGDRLRLLRVRDGPWDESRDGYRVDEAERALVVWHVRTAQLKARIHHGTPFHIGRNSTHIVLFDSLDELHQDLTTLRVAWRIEGVAGKSVQGRRRMRK